MEALVTSRLESEMHRLPGIREVESVSMLGAAQLSLAYERGVSMDRAELLLSDRLASMKESLPVDVTPPVIERWVPSEHMEKQVLL